MSEETSSDLSDSCTLRFKAPGLVCQRDCSNWTDLKINSFSMLVSGSSTGSPETSGCIVSFVFCEDLPVWGRSTPALDGTLYTGLDFTLLESFQTFIHCVYISQYKRQYCRSLALVYTLCNKWVLKILFVSYSSFM